MSRPFPLLRRLARTAVSAMALAWVAACGGGGGDTAAAKPDAVIWIRNTTVAEAGGIQQAVLTMINPTGVTCRLTVNTADGSAQAGLDYVPINGATVVMAGVGSVPLPLTPLDDDLVEGDETFTVSIAVAPGSDPQCTIGEGVATITVTSEDVPSYVSIDDATVYEAPGSQNATQIRIGPVGPRCPVIVQTVDGSALAGADYVAINGVQYDAGVPVPLQVIDDSLVEANETFTVNISLAPNVDPRCRIDKGQATITVVSNE